MDEHQRPGTAPTPTTGRKTFKYQLQPTPQQTTALQETLRLCRQLYNCALEQRRV
jgi:putative transposase